MVLTKKLKFQNPTIQMAGSQINLVEEIKVLGLIIDTTLNFRSHVAAVCKKSIEIYKRLACSAKVTWGLNSEIIRIIYTAVIEPIMMYASNTWAPATELEMIRSALNSLQRGFAIKICRAYRTVSLTSAMILAGLLPLDLRIREAEALYKAKKGLSMDYLPPGKELETDIANTERPHPAKAMSIEYELIDESDPDPLGKIAGPQIYTDGSKINGRVGAAITWWTKDTESEYQNLSLHPSCSVYQAEMYALYRAVAMVKASREKVVNILSDSRSSLELLSNPRAGHPLAHAIKESTRNANAEEKEIHFYWLVKRKNCKRSANSSSEEETTGSDSTVVGSDSESESTYSATSGTRRLTGSRSDSPSLVEGKNKRAIRKALKKKNISNASSTSEMEVDAAQAESVSTQTPRPTSPSAQGPVTTSLQLKTDRAPA
ncbi:Retrovirus-related Pol polyprotein from type-1 retrotransposable element R1 4 [Eumeta japonica]|uniref:Retrovirus-related Pol polyprotein from type-1 retrotransposable element R1 4 n=1 Tax=Eumeta variegata TaxID=151549 RepID=A0A4C1Z5E8_EUMVA|nr:Retrovirus-related Pol polyprotein from type-1 retrotransposable element R1 4 [Eumeta japonica]